MPLVTVIILLMNCINHFIFSFFGLQLVMEKYRHQLMQMKEEASLQWNSVQHLIGLGKSVLDFIQIYTIHEPKSFPQLEKLSLYTVDLRKGEI